jgi:hypothetical protein
MDCMTTKETPMPNREDQSHQKVRRKEEAGITDEFRLDVTRLLLCAAGSSLSRVQRRMNRRYSQSKQEKKEILVPCLFPVMSTSGALLRRIECSSCSLSLVDYDMLVFVVYCVDVGVSALVRDTKLSAGTGIGGSGVQRVPVPLVPGSQDYFLYSTVPGTVSSEFLGAHIISTLHP